MALTVEQIQILVDAKVDKAIKNLKKTQKEGDKTESKFLSMAKSLAGPIGAGLIIASFVRISKQSSKLAADAEEVRSKFKAVFGDTANEVGQWADTYSEAVGRSETDTLKFLGTIGDTLKPLGFAKDAVDDMSKQVVALAGDLGSFNNIPTEEVIAGIQSALVGNVETLRRYGVVANETAIKQEAINSGLWDGEGALTAQEKAQAILQITMKGTTDAQGDLLRTQDSAANVQASLNSTLKETAEIYGEVLNKGLTPIKAALQEELAEINNTIKAYFLKNKVLAGEATLIESLISKKNEQIAAEKELQQAKDNLAESSAKIEELSNSEIVSLQNSAKAIEASLPAQQKLIDQRTADVEAIERQIGSLARANAEEQNAVDILALLNAGSAENTENTDENTESVDENTEAVENNILAWTGSRDIVRDTGVEISNAVTEMIEYNKQLQEAEINAETLATIGMNSMLTGFEALGKSIVEGGLQFKDFGKLALGALADVLSSMGAQLAAQAALHFFGLFPNVASGAGAAAGAAAAFTASGVARGIAGALPEGGSFTTNGPQTLLVGDNPGGQEEVSVNPVSSSGANQRNGGGGGTMKVLIDFGGGRVLTGMVQDDIDNRNLRRSTGGAI